MSLFSRSPKNDLSLESAEEDQRARIQAAIERALLLPEVEVPERPEIKPLPVCEDVSETAA